MQIKTHLSDCASKLSENVVQKIPKASYPRKNEIHLKYECMYIRVCSYDKIVHNKKYYRKQNECCHHQWLLSSLCLNNSFKIKCLALNFWLFKYLFIKSFILINFTCPFDFIYIFPIKCISLQHCYGKGRTRTALTMFLCRRKHQMVETVLVIGISYNYETLIMVETCFYTMLFKILLRNLFYECFNCARSKCKCINQNFNRSVQIYCSTCYNIKTLCELSTNNDEFLLFISSMLLISVKFGIEYHLCIVIKPSSRTSLLTEMLRSCTLKVFYGILQIKRHFLIRHNYEFNNKYERLNNNKNNNNNKINILTANDEIWIIKNLPACNQVMVLRITSIRHWRCYHSVENCHVTLLIENKMSTLTTSNHKLKVEHHNSNTCDYFQHHKRNESEGVKEYPALHRPSSVYDTSMKHYLNAVLFFIILCIPLLTTASSTHNLKYSTNVVKTKYGPLRGIIIRQNPTVEGFLGVPYGKIDFIYRFFL